MNRGAGALLVLLGALVVAGFGLFLSERRGTTEAAREVESLRTLRAADERRTILDRAAEERSRKDLLDRMEALQKRVADLEAAGRAREGELLAARADLERLRRGAEEEARRREAAEREAERLRGALAAAKAAPEPAPPAVEKPPVEKPPVEKPPAEKPPAPGLGPTAVSDPHHVRKLTDGLNALLAGVEGSEKWRVVSAGAVEDDRLVQVVLEARGADGTIAKAFQAGEGRFVLQASAGTLSIKLKEGSVTYPGNRTVPFPEGAYTVLLVVDPAPFRAAGNPLVTIL